MKEKIAKAIRIVTISPVAALMLLAILYASRPDIFGDVGHLAFAILFLVLLPISAYPLQPLLPIVKHQGRRGQRNLAIVMANVGYIAGIIFVLLVPASKGYLVIYLTYFISGLLFILFNKVFKVKASGHACGVAGPIVALTYYVGPIGLLGIPVLIAACWASLTIKRHTKGELIVGSLISIIALFISIYLLRFI